MEYGNIVKEQINNIDGIEGLEKINRNTSDISGGLSEYFTFDSILESTLNGESIFVNQELISSLKSLFFYEIRGAMVMGCEILVICIAMGLITNLSGTLGKKSMSEMSILVISMIITGISVNSFVIAYELSIDSVTTMVNTMEIIAPVLAGILISTGNITSGTIMSPLIIGTITGTGIIIKKIILPALFAATILTLINCLTEKNYVKKLSSLLRKGAVGVTGLILAILSGIISVQGLITEASDGLLINTAKYSMNTFIPIVGGFTADTAELFIKCMGTIKGVAGVFGIIAIILTIIIPVIKIITVALVYKVTAAAAEPLCSSRISDGISDMGICMISVASIMFFTALLFIIFITIFLSIGS